MAERKIIKELPNRVFRGKVGKREVEPYNALLQAYNCGSNHVFSVADPWLSVVSEVKQSF